MKPLISKKAKENQKRSGGAVPQKSAEPVETRKELAKIADVRSSPYFPPRATM